jgi:hypothetical protein
MRNHGRYSVSRLKRHLLAELGIPNLGLIGFRAVIGRLANFSSPTFYTLTNERCEGVNGYMKKKEAYGTSRFNTGSFSCRPRPS